MISKAAAVCLLAAATLAFEIILIRVFALEHFHHVAYMAIGVAMLGSGASGTLLAIAGGPRGRAAERWFPGVAILTALSLIATPALLHRITLDLTQLAWNPEQWLRLGAVYLLLALPFGLSALAILFAITAESGRPGWMYGASFLAAALGAALAVGMLWLAAPTRALAMPALIGAFGALAAAQGGLRRTERLATVAALGAALLAVVRPPWRVGVSPYKGLTQVEAYPDAKRVAERATPLGWVIAVQSSMFRHAPGLSVTFTGEFPPQTALFVDGELSGAVTRWDAGGSGRPVLELLEWLPTALPYALGGRERVLILGAGGGMDVWQAVAHGARRIAAVELNPALIAVSADLAPLPTNASTAARIDWMVGDARAVVAQSRERFDLITLASGGGLSGVAGGLHALNEDFLHTTDAYAQYLTRLSPRGVLAVTQWISVPPRGSVRVILTAAEAVRRVRPAALANGIVVARSWGTVTTLVKPSGFSPTELDRLGVWAASRQVDLDWSPGAAGADARYNIPDEPTLVHAARAAVAHPDSARRFAARYPFAVAPASDARPYPHRFLRAGALGRFLRSGSAGWLPFAEWGYIALLATLVQSAALAALVMLVPAILHARAMGVQKGRELISLLGYFSAIGLGYMAAEIAVIQQLTLLLGHPVYAVTTVLAAILIWSGLGSAWSDRVAPARARFAGILLAVSLAVLAAVLLDIVHLLQSASIVIRGLAAAAVLAPVAAVMGMMFPLGLRAIARDDGGRIAWAWAANGFASVVGVPLAALIAVESGSRVLLLVAMGAYAAASLFIRR